MMSEEGKREIELMRQLRKAKSVQEVLELAKVLEWDVSEKEAREYLGLIRRTNKRSKEADRMDEEKNKFKESLFSAEEVDKMLLEYLFGDSQEEEKQRPTLEDFFGAESRKEKEVILQEIYGGTLTPEELEAFFPKD